MGARAGARGKHRAAAWCEARVEGTHTVKVVKLKEAGRFCSLVAERRRVRAQKRLGEREASGGVREKQSRRREEGEKVQGRR